MHTFICPECKCLVYNDGPWCEECLRKLDPELRRLYEIEEEFKKEKENDILRITKPANENA